jgi:DNA polymerase III alpha subunit
VVESSGAKTSVRIGLGSIKGGRSVTWRRLLQSRRAAGPFTDLAEFLERVRPSRQECEALVLCGACDALAPLSADAYPFIHEVVLEHLRAYGAVAPPEVAGAALARVRRDRPEELARYQALSRVNNEIQYLEMHVSGHPMQLLRSDAVQYGCVSVTELSRNVGRRVRFAGVVAASRPVPNEQRDVTQFITLEDETGLVEGILFDRVGVSVRPRITTPGPYLVIAEVTDDRGAISLLIDDLMPFHERGQLVPQP